MNRLLKCFQRVSGAVEQRVRKSGRCSDQPQVEALEGRQLFSTTCPLAFAPPFVRIEGTPSNDNVTVQFDKRGTSSPYDDQVVVTHAHEGLTETVRCDVWATIVDRDGVPLLRIRQITGVEFRAGEGDDSFANNTSLPSVAYGGGGSDTLIGGSGKDLLDGDGRCQIISDVSPQEAPRCMNPGDDVLHGRGGNDELYGGEGHDQLFGEAGNDYLDGGSDGVSDYLWGGAGADQFITNLLEDQARDFNAAQGDRIS